MTHFILQPLNNADMQFYANFSRFRSLDFIKEDVDPLECLSESKMPKSVPATPAVLGYQSAVWKWFGNVADKSAMRCREDGHSPLSTLTAPVSDFTGPEKQF